MLITGQFRYITPKHLNREGCYYINGDSVQVISLPSNVGGRRLWLRCDCGRTVAKLYLYRMRFSCRYCLRLGYQSQLVDGHTRQCWREEKLRKLLPCGARRPKGMHRTTYQKIKADIRNAREMQDRYFCAMALPFLRRFK